MGYTGKWDKAERFGSEPEKESLDAEGRHISGR
jgi:hypothetical protein